MKPRPFDLGEQDRGRRRLPGVLIAAMKPRLFDLGDQSIAEVTVGPWEVPQ